MIKAIEHNARHVCKACMHLNALIANTVHDICTRLAVLHVVTSRCELIGVILLINMEECAWPSSSASDSIVHLSNVVTCL